MLVRLQKAIADAGVTSRRKAETLITAGLVRVNNQIVKTLGTKVDIEEDVIAVQGKLVDPRATQHLYILFHKPRGCVTTVSDPEGRPTVMEYLPKLGARLYPVGRLDYLSEGLLLFTNDGEFTQKILHPKYEIEKTYEVKVFGHVDSELLKRLRRGIHSPVGYLEPSSVRILKFLPHKTWLEIKLKEGKNREIRRLCEELGLTIDKLRRMAIGELNIGNLAPGKFDFLTKKQILAALGMTSKGDVIYQVKTAGRVFESPKKSISPSKRRKTSETASHPKYRAYRKENYYATLQIGSEKEKESEGDKPEVLEKTRASETPRPEKKLEKKAERPSSSGRSRKAFESSIPLKGCQQKTRSPDRRN